AYKCRRSSAMRTLTLSVLLSFCASLAAGCASPGDGREIAQTSRESGSLLIEIRENGEIGVDGQLVGLRNLRAFVERAHLERPGDSAVIVPHRSASTGAIVQVMDEVRLAGIGEIMFAAEGRPNGS